jgi:hypothetical protein
MFFSNEFRDLFFRTRVFQNEFGVLVGDLELDLPEYIRQLTSCFRTYPRYFENESAQDLESIRLCYSD